MRMCAHFIILYGILWYSSILWCLIMICHCILWYYSVSLCFTVFYCILCYLLTFAMNLRSFQVIWDVGMQHLYRFLQAYVTIWGSCCAHFIVFWGIFLYFIVFYHDMLLYFILCYAISWDFTIFYDILCHLVSSGMHPKLTGLQNLLVSDKKR